MKHCWTRPTRRIKNSCGPNVDAKQQNVFASNSTNDTVSFPYVSEENCWHTENSYGAYQEV